MKAMGKIDTSSELWIHLEREYLARFPDANNDDENEFLIRFNKTEGTEKKIETLFVEEKERRKNSLLMSE